MRLAQKQILYYVNGAFLAEDKASLPITDLGILRGLGVFEYLRTYSGRPFHLKDHLIRLQKSCEALALALPKSFEEIESIIDHLLLENGFSESSIKILVTGGIGENQLLPIGNSSLVIMVYPFTPILEPVCYEKGISVMTAQDVRPFPTAKTTYYAPAIVALQKARKENCSDVLFTSAKNEILEATTSNFFAIKGNRLITAEENILHGITRAIVLGSCSQGFQIEKRALHLDELKDLSAAFLTATNKGIVPISSINKQLICSGEIDKSIHLIQKRLEDYIAKFISL